MRYLIKSLSGITLGLSTTLLFASPAFLITHNHTDVESNAYINEKPSPNPTKANKDSMILWGAVRMICYQKTSNNLCPALIKMATNTNQPVELGLVQMNIETGEISPKLLSKNGYTLTVNGPGEATLTKN